MKLKSLWYKPYLPLPNTRLTLIGKIGSQIQEMVCPEQPYFYIDKTRQKMWEYYCKRHGVNYEIEDSKFKTLDERSTVKIICEHPKQVGNLRHNTPLESMEADIVFTRRVMIDQNWQVDPNYKIGYFDSEQFDGVSTNRYETGQFVALSIVDKDRNERLFQGDNELDILLDFIDEALHYDMLVGYYSSEHDVPKLKECLKKYTKEHETVRDIYRLLRSIRFLDFLDALKASRQQMLSEWSLKAVSEQLIQQTRKHADKKICESTDEEIGIRCLWDSQLVKMLDDKERLTDVAIGKAVIAGIFPDEATTTYTKREKWQRISGEAKCVDTLLLKKARELEYCLPNKPKEYKEVEKHSGAMILKPSEAFRVFENVGVLDFAALYPTIIINFNVSPDKDKRLIPEMLQELMDKRLEHKKKWQDTGSSLDFALQYAYKIICNATYGVVSSSGFRLRNRELGDFVATKGREVLQTSIDRLESLGHEVIYADTDSCFVQLTPSNNLGLDISLNALTEVVEQRLISNMQMRADLEADRIYSKLFFTQLAKGDDPAKKRYAGLIAWKKGKGFLSEPEKQFVGLEAIQCLPSTCLLVVKNRGAIKTVRACDLARFDFTETTILTEVGFRKILSFVRQIRKASLKRIVLLNGISFSVTGNHKIPILEKGNIVLKRADKLEVGNFVAYQDCGYNDSNLGDYNFGKFVGLFAAEGSFSQGVRFGFHMNENHLIDFVKTFLYSRFAVNAATFIDVKRHCTIVYAKANIDKFIENFVSGKGKERTFSPEIINYSLAFRRGIIDGLWLGDGDKRHNVLTTISRNMADKICVLMNSVGELYSYHVQRRHNRNKTSYRIKRCKKSNMSNIWQKAQFYGNLIFLPIKTIEDNHDSVRKKPTYVYDIEVDSPQHFIRLANGILVHNSHYPPLIQRFQKSLIQYKFDGLTNPEILSFCKSYKEAFFHDTVNIADLAISKTLSKENYKKKPHHAQAADKLKELGIKKLVGDKIQYLHTKTGIEPLHDGVTIKDVDLLYYWKHFIVPICLRTVGIDLKQVGLPTTMDMFAQ